MNEKKSGSKWWIIALIIFIVLGFMFFIIGTALFAVGIFVFVDKTLNDYVIKIGSYDSNMSGYTDRVFTDYNSYSYYFDSTTLTKEDFEKNNYYIFKIQYDPCSEEDFRVNTYRGDFSRQEYEIGISYKAKCGGCAPEYLFYALKLDKDVTNPKVKVDYNARNTPNCPHDVAYKPMIYLYPEKDMNVNVKLGNSKYLTTTYPKYNNEWNVYAKTNGDLLLNGRTYYGLYWEGNNHKVEVKEDGFVVKGEDTAKFLEEKLAVLGLTEREANEFIVYWLPKMEHNKYNYIRFETKEEIDKYMPMEVSPKPDTVIRVYMNYKALDEKINVEEQQLTKVNRKGFTVVEWGGSIIK